MGHILQQNEFANVRLICLFIISFLLLTVVDANSASSILRNYADAQKASQTQRNVPKPIGSKQQHIPNILFSDNYMTMDEGSLVHLYGSGRFNGDGISIIRQDEPKSQPKTEQNFIKFSPNELILDDLHSCKLHSLNIEVENGGTEDITIQSVSTDVDVLTILDQEIVVLKPGDKITVGLQLLASKSLFVRGSILVITSLGEIKYSIEANIISNPYEVSGLTATIASGVRLEHTLMIHNPFDQAIRVSEAYSLDGLVHLFLPQPMQISPEHMSKEIWYIGAKSTIELVTFSFVSRVPNVYKTDIRVVLQNDTLVIPIHMRVLREGLHLEPEDFHLGVITRIDERRELKVDLLNSGHVPILIQDIITEDPKMIVSAALRGPTIIPSRTRIKGSIVLSLGHNACDGNFVSSLRLVTNHTSLTIDGSILKVTGYIMAGYLQVKRLDTLARIFSPISVNSSSKMWRMVPFGKSTMHKISILNMYQEPLKLVDVTIENGDVAAELKMLDFSRASVAHNGETWPEIRFQITPTMQHPVSVHSYQIIITTNMTLHTAELSIFHGFLLVRSEQELVDLSEKFTAVDPSASGKVNRAYQMQLPKLVKGLDHIAVLNITNVNPVPIYIENVIVMSDSVQIDVDDVQPSVNAPVFINTSFTIDDNFVRDIEEKILTGRSPLPPGFTVSLHLRFRPQQYGTNTEHLFQYQTPFEVVNIFAQFIAMEGRIFPHSSKIVLPPTYPGKVQVISLLYGNSFDRAVALMSAKCTNKMMRILSITKFLHYEKPNPAVTFAISPLYNKECSDLGFLADCLVPLNKAYQLSRFKEPVSQEDVDAHLSRLDKYLNLKNSGKAQLVGEIFVQSELMDSTPVRIIAPFTRPYLSSDKYFAFDVTEVSKTSSIKIRVVNPSNISIFVELSALKHDSMIFFCDSSEGNSRDFYHNKTCYQRWLQKEGKGPNFPFFIELKTVELHPGSEALLGPIFFSPSMVKDYNATLFIKNSLTHIEPIHIVGEGAKGKLEVLEILDEGKESALGRNGSLRFTTMNVEKEYHCPSKRHLRLMNKGKFSVSVKSIDVASYGETAYFSVSWPSNSTLRNSKLEPGESLIFTVSHTPICHATKVEDVISIVSSMDSFSVRLTGEMSRSTAFECLHVHFASRYLVLYFLLWVISASATIFLIFTVMWWHRSMIQDRVCEVYNRLLNNDEKTIDSGHSETDMDRMVILKEIMDRDLLWDQFKHKNLRYKPETSTVMKLLEMRQKGDKTVINPSSIEKTMGSAISESKEFSQTVLSVKSIAHDDKYPHVNVIDDSYNAEKGVQHLCDEDSDVIINSTKGNEVTRVWTQSLNVSRPALTEESNVGLKKNVCEYDLIAPKQSTESSDSEHNYRSQSSSEVLSDMNSSFKCLSTNAKIRKIEQYLTNSSDKEGRPIVVEDKELKLNSSLIGVWLSNSVKEMKDNKELTRCWEEDACKIYSCNESSLNMNGTELVARGNGNQLRGSDQKDYDDWSDLMFHSIKSEIGKLVSEGSNQQEENDLQGCTWPEKVHNSRATGNLKLKSEDSNVGRGIKSKSTPPGFSPEDAKPEETLVAFQNLLRLKQDNGVTESTEVGSTFQTSTSRAVEKDITLSTFNKPFSLFGSSSQQTPERPSAYPNAGRIGSRKTNTTAVSPSLPIEFAHNFASLSSLGGVELCQARPPPGL